jgi:WD40 repeat protein
LLGGGNSKSESINVTNRTFTNPWIILVGVVGLAVTGASLPFLNLLARVDRGVRAETRSGHQLASLAALSDLRELDLGLTKLEGLRLDKTAVTDAGLDRLEGLEHLHTLSLSDTKVTEAGVRRLREALPKTAIIALGRKETGARRDAPRQPPVLEIEAKPRAAFGIGGFSYTDTAYAFSPDGKYFAVGGYGVLLLRDAQTAKVLFDLGEELEKVKGDVRCLAFSPDGKTLAVGGYYRGFLRFWDVATRKWRATLEGHTGSVLAVAFSPDGKTLASGGNDGTLRLWDVRTAKETAQKKPHGDWVFAVGFSPDGKALASAGADNDVLVWDLATGKPRHRLRGHENAVDTLVFSRDGKLLASGSRERTTRLWDTATGKKIRHIPGSVGTFSPDGRYWISCGDSRLVVWDVATGARRAHILRPAPVYAPVSLAVSPDGKTLAVRCDSERIYLWDLDSVWPTEKEGRTRPEE